MRYHWENIPIVYKLFLPLFIGISTIIVLLLVYVWGYESELILKKEDDLLHLQATHVAHDLMNHTQGLHKELLFLSHLEVMDDMVVGDMDRRITRILEQKGDDLGESILLLAVDVEGKIRASSHAILINHPFRGKIPLDHAITAHHASFVDHHTLYLVTPIRGSFEHHPLLGYLVLAYPLENFTHSLHSDTTVHKWLTPPLPLKNPYGTGVAHQEAYLQQHITLGGVLSGWRLHYALPKHEALAVLYHVQTLFLTAFGVGLLIIAFLVWMILLQIITPLRALSQTAKRIAATGDYTQGVIERGNDEVGKMAKSFNALITTTRMSMERIELLGKRQSALQAKSSFLSAMSHELRTPLGSILSSTQYLIAQPTTSDEVVDTLGKIEHSAHHLLGVINNVLELAKVESGKMVPRIIPCDPTRVIEQALDLVSPLAHEKELTIQTHIQTDGATCASDPRLIGQVIINLLSNAIKFTQKGSISVKLSHHEGIFVVTITDTGCGIEPAMLEKVWDEFYQANSTHPNATMGSGLGLAISQGLATVLQGSLTLHSEGRGKGTRAVFSFGSLVL